MAAGFLITRWQGGLEKVSSRKMGVTVFFVTWYWRWHLPALFILYSLEVTRSNLYTKEEITQTWMLGSKDHWELMSFQCLSSLKPRLRFNCRSNSEEVGPWVIILWDLLPCGGNCGCYKMPNLVPVFLSLVLLSLTTGKMQQGRPHQMPAPKICKTPSQ